MRPTFLGFESARKALAVNQKGLDIVGHNLANVHTAGYTRQRVDIYSIAPNTTKTRYATPRSEFSGQGVGMSGVSQTRDPFLDRRFRDEYSEVGYYDQVTAILEDVEAAIGEYGSDTGLKNAIKTISDSLDKFSSNPDSKVNANVVQTAFKNITQVLHQFDAKLNNVALQQTNDLEISAKNVNDILTKLVGLNKTIGDDVKAQASNNEYYGPNELLDERNLLLDELARYGDITTKQNSDGTVTVTMSGRVVLDDQRKDTLNFRKNSDETVSLTWNSDGKNFSSSGGALQGAVDIINGRGPLASSMNETSDRGIRYFKDKINTVAKTLSSVFNKIVPMAGADGKVMKNPDGSIMYKQLLGARTVGADGTVSVNGNANATAANISLSEEWSANSSYVIFFEGDKNSEYAIAMKTALNSTKQNFSFGGSTITMTFEEFVNDYSGICSTDAKFNTGRLEASSAIADDLLDRRDQISAVAPDEETANMMLYNKSYQAISRLMTSLDEALDILINRTGMVGR